MEALRRIVALLFALAALAEHAAGRCLPVRWLVISGLWQADDIARHVFVGPSCNAAARHGHEPTDAINLAASLRALALVVGNIAARLRQRLAARAFDGSGRDGSHERQIKGLWRAANAGPEPLDTS